MEYSLMKELIFDIGYFQPNHLKKSNIESVEFE